jgi:hypothetical protein
VSTLKRLYSGNLLQTDVIKDIGLLHCLLCYCIAFLTSAKEIQNEGLELGKITTIQQEKIEELFLHLIEMEKRLKKLEKENQALKAQIIKK